MNRRGPHDRGRRIVERDHRCDRRPDARRRCLVPLERRRDDPGAERLGEDQRIAWLNADDAYVPANVDSAVAGLMAAPATDALFGFQDIVDEHGTFVKRYRCGPFSWHRYLYLGDYLPTPTIIFRRALLARAPRLDERYLDAADCDFYLRLLRGARVRRVRAPLVRFRYHEASKTASNLPLQIREALEIRLAHAPTSPERALIRVVHSLKHAQEIVRPSWRDLRTKT